MIDIQLPEVQSFQQQPRFYKENNKDYVEISFVGSKDTIVKRVTPELMQRFRVEWDAYCDGRPMEQRKGTPLTDLSEISEQMAAVMIARNLHTLEELSVLNDAQCQSFGHGTINLRRKAQALVALRQLEKNEQTQKAISEMTAAAVANSAETGSELSELKAVVSEQAKKIDLLVDTLGKLAAQVAPRKPGRPRKDANGAKLNP